MFIPPFDEAILHPKNFVEAAKAQIKLAEKIIISDQYPDLRVIAGIDVSNNLYDPNQFVYAAIVVLDYQTLALIETATAAEKQILPYQPGFLGFREVPVILRAWEKLQTQPDILLVDGHGISHPRQFGVATHLGVLLDMPTIGVAKSILVGKPSGELSQNIGDIIPLMFKGKIIGTLLRSKKRANPLIISPGHRVSLESALEIVKNCLRGYRLPEPTRLAHNAANEFRLANR